MNRRLPLFSLATLALVVMALAWLRRDANHQPATAIAVATASRTATAPFLMYRTLAPPRAYGRVTIAPLDRLEPRRLTPLRCTRVHYGGNRGLCLSEHAEGTTVSHVADVFDSAFRRHQRIELAGVPTRVRVSPDGRLASVTTYAEEESPAGERLAIESVLIDLEAGRVLADLREFALQSDDDLDGPRDFASVSFAADGDRFYATLSTPDARYVLVGSLRERRLRTVKQGVAAEALSPDGRRLAVKQRIGDRSYWQLAVLDLATLAETPIDQGGRSVDDQVEWLDDERLVYHDAGDAGTGIWVTAADGRSAPRLLVLDAFSPAVVQRSR